MSTNIIKTEAVAAGVAKTTPINLDKTSETYIEFQANVHDKGTSGSIIKYKKDKKSEWNNIKRDDFKSHALSIMEKVVVSLSTDALQKLVTEIQLRDKIAQAGVQFGTHEYIPVEKGSAIIVNDQNKKQILEDILSRGYSDEFWSILATNQPDLANRLTAGHLQLQREGVVLDLKERLTRQYSETQGDDSWQKWIFKNNWLFGVNYETPIEKQKINISGIMPDYLFPTVDGFVDILEIKLPADEVVAEDVGHPGSWRWTPATNAAIGQVVHYLAEIDRLKLEIENNIRTKYAKEVSCLKPRAYVLIGDSISWAVEKKEGLRKLNHSLHGIEVITYFDLSQRGKRFAESPVAGLVIDDIAYDEIPF